MTCRRRVAGEAVADGRGWWKASKVMAKPRPLSDLDSLLPCQLVRARRKDPLAKDRRLAKSDHLDVLEMPAVGHISMASREQKLILGACHDDFDQTSVEAQVVRSLSARHPAGGVVTTAETFNARRLIS